MYRLFLTILTQDAFRNENPINNLKARQAHYLLMQMKEEEMALDHCLIM